MKFLIALIFFSFTQALWADNSDRFFNVESNVVRQENTFLIYVSYQTPLSVCQAYQFLIDYEAAKKIPGVIDSKVTRESADKVLVERSVEEKILFFTVKLHTLLEYTEYPFKGTEFTQIKGDSKRFSGKWFIEPHTLGSVIKYEGVLEPDSTLPMFILKYFIENNLEDRFRFMAKMASERKTLDLTCNN